MPMVTIKFDDKKVTDDKIIKLSNAIKKIVSEATRIEDVFVYADSPRITINIAPIEIFVELSASILENKEGLSKTIRDEISIWKKENNFEHPINLTLIPMNWRFEVGI